MPGPEGRRDVMPRQPATDGQVDERQKLLDAALRRHQYRQDALIEILHAAQKAYGYLSPETLWYVARQLRLPPSRVQGVASFYHFFSLTPPGTHSVAVCDGTVCHLFDASRLADALSEAFGIQPGRTSADGRLSLSLVKCVGTCTLAPLAVVDGEVVGPVGSEAIVARTRALLEGKEASPAPTAGKVDGHER